VSHSKRSWFPDAGLQSQEKYGIYERKVFGSCSYDYYDNTVLISPVFIKAEKNKFICQGEITSLPEK
jgi:hypothetical protein